MSQSSIPRGDIGVTNAGSKTGPTINPGLGSAI